VPFNRHIYELLIDNEVVIIPDFGAFVTSVMPSRTDIVSGTLLPPSKVIRFDPKIRNNDWVLVRQMAGSEGISEHDALKKIRKICDEVLYRLDNGERITFEKLGILYFDNNKELCFDQDRETELNLDSYGLEPVPIPEASEIQEEIQEVPIPAAESKNKMKFVWPVIILTIFASAIFIYRILDKPATLPEPEQSIPPEYMVPDTRSPKDRLKQDTVEQEVVHTVVDTLAGKKYYVIGGSFENEENALSYIGKMESKGFKPFMTNKKGRFFIVAVGAFSDLKQASNFKHQLEEETNNQGIWIMPQ
jgi:cell division septation protein DedD